MTPQPRSNAFIKPLSSHRPNISRPSPFYSTQHIKKRSINCLFCIYIYIMPSLPGISSLSSLPVLSQLQALDTLFEPSENLHGLIIPVLVEGRFTSYNGLIDAVEDRLRRLASDKDSDINTLHSILGCHPRLGESAAAAAATVSESQKPHLSELSKLEQANLVSASASTAQVQEEARRLMELNREYEEKFPGLRYVYVYFFFYNALD